MDEMKKLMAGAPRLLDEVEAGLTLAEQTFSRYEDLHREKGTREGNEKANANAALQLRMEEALAYLPGLRAAVNALPELIALREENARMREALKLYEKCAELCIDSAMFSSKQGVVACIQSTRNNARAALKETDNG